MRLAAALVLGAFLCGALPAAHADSEQAHREKIQAEKRKIKAEKRKIKQEKRKIKEERRRKEAASSARKQDDWGRFNASSKRDLDAADRKKAEKAAKK